MATELRDFIRDVPDFPKKGIIFKDITTLLKDKEAFKRGIELLSEPYLAKGVEKVVSVEARGFILGAGVAYRLGTGFVPVRKPNKLPAETLKEEYELEYGTDAVQVHRDGIKPGERVLVVDDLLATGGTALATCRLVERLGGEVVGVAFLIELSFLKGRDKLKGYEVFSLITYKEED